MGRTIATPGGPPCGVGEHPAIWYEAGYADARGYWDPAYGPPGKIIAPVDPHGEVVDWSWTLNYGYGKPPGNDIIYGLDPGPPFLAYDMTVEARRPGLLIGWRLDPEHHGHAHRVPGCVRDARWWRHHAIDSAT